MLKGKAPPKCLYIHFPVFPEEEEEEEEKMVESAQEMEIDQS